MKPKSGGKFISYLPVEEILFLYSQGLSTSKIAKKFGCSVTHVNYLRRKHGLPPRNRTDLNHNIFDIIDTEEKAYWLGFFTADGCINTGRNKHRISLQLQAIDYQHVYKFRQFLGAGSKVYCGGNPDGSTRLEAHSPRIVLALSSYGVTPRKTFTATSAVCLFNPELHRHYWRGFIDGDGTIVLSGKQPRIKLYGTLDVVKSFRDFCNTLCPTRADVYRADSIFCFGVSSKPAFSTVGRALYDDSNIFLNRKKRKFYSMLSEYGEYRFDMINANRIQKRKDSIDGGM